MIYYFATIHSTIDPLGEDGLLLRAPRVLGARNMEPGEGSLDGDFRLS